MFVNSDADGLKSFGVVGFDGGPKELSYLFLGLFQGLSKSFKFFRIHVVSGELIGKTGQPVSRARGFSIKKLRTKSRSMVQWNCRALLWFFPLSRFHASLN